MQLYKIIQRKFNPSINMKFTSHKPNIQMLKQLYKYNTIQLKVFIYTTGYSKEALLYSNQRISECINSLSSGGKREGGGASTISKLQFHFISLCTLVIKDLFVKKNHYSYLIHTHIHGFHLNANKTISILLSFPNMHFIVTTF